MTLVIKRKPIKSYFNRFTLTTRPFDNGKPGQFVLFDCDLQLVITKIPTQIEQDAWTFVARYNCIYDEAQRIKHNSYKHLN